jgi:hypothetical protein
VHDARREQYYQKARDYHSYLNERIEERYYYPHYELEKIDRYYRSPERIEYHQLYHPPKYPMPQFAFHELERQRPRSQEREHKHTTVNQSKLP